MWGCVCCAAVEETGDGAAAGLEPASSPPQCPARFRKSEHWSTTGGSSLSYAARAIWHTRASARLTPSRHHLNRPPAFGSADGKAVMGDRWASRLLEWRAGVGRVVTAEISAARYSVRADQHEALAWAEVSLAVGAGSRSGVSQLWRRLVRLRSGMRTCGAGGMGIRGQMSPYRNAGL
jgi:hypothetical protein